MLCCSPVTQRKNELGSKKTQMPDVWKSAITMYGVAVISWHERGKVVGFTTCIVWSKKYTAVICNKMHNISVHLHGTIKVPKHLRKLASWRLAPLHSVMLLAELKSISLYFSSNISSLFFSFTGSAEELENGTEQRRKLEDELHHVHNLLLAVIKAVPL